ncbi:MAG: hypothetical protein MZV64_73425 [Ignavibacteriales bacterium]|nr:hypothetical protein [Ignavibacteriales bacterium]
MSPRSPWARSRPGELRPGRPDPVALRRQGAPGRRAAHRRQPDAGLDPDRRGLASAAPPREHDSRPVGLLLPDRRLRRGAVDRVVRGVGLACSAA